LLELNPVNKALKSKKPCFMGGIVRWLKRSTNFRLALLGFCL
jgi:hypothetical protein